MCIIEHASLSKRYACAKHVLKHRLGRTTQAMNTGNTTEVLSVRRTYLRVLCGSVSRLFTCDRMMNNPLPLWFHPTSRPHSCLSSTPAPFTMVRKLVMYLYELKVLAISLMSACVLLFLMTPGFHGTNAVFMLTGP